MVVKCRGIFEQDPSEAIEALYNKLFMRGWWDTANTLHVFHRFTLDGGDVASRFSPDLLWVL